MNEYFSDLKTEFSAYNKEKLIKDLSSGATVAAVAIPLALAFGVSSGASAAAGLITAIVAGVVIGLFSGAYYQISGPTGAMAAILISIVSQFGMQGVFVATFLAGIFLVFAGIFHLGRVIAYIPMPVITGFTSGIAVIIALGQIDNFFGTSSNGANILGKLSSYFSQGFYINPGSTLLGLFVVLFMVFLPAKYTKLIPSSLIAIILATIISWAFSLNITKVGQIPTSIFIDERFFLKDFNFLYINDLIVPAISIALLAMVESLLCGASARSMAGVRLKCDRELIAQGLGNILVPFFGGIPATAAIARTSVAIKSGAVTRLSGIFHALILLASMLILSPIMSQIPLCALAGVLFVTAFKMNDWSTIKYIFKNRFKGAMAKFLVTMLSTILFDLTTAILIGVILSLIILLARLSHIKIRYDIFDTSKLVNLKNPIPKEYTKVEVVYIMGALIFANTEKILELANLTNNKTAIIFSMRGTTYMDISGASAFLQMLKTIKDKNIPVIIAGVNDEIKSMMKRSKIVDFVGEDNFYWSVEMIAK